MKTLGSRIAHYRKLAGLSQAQLAVACGWKSQSRVGNYEANTREPTLADLEKLARALKVSVPVLTYGSGDLEPSEKQLRDIRERSAIAAALASPRSREILESITQAAEDGLLTDEDVELLEMVVQRIMARAVALTTIDPLDGSNTRLRNRLKNAPPDPDTQR